MPRKYSLIVPVYQVEGYLKACLDSVFGQIPRDMQVILVDDGSTDASGAICDEYAQRYPQTQVIHQGNRGVAAARNAGLQAAEGEYLLWVDPDDWVAENWFSEIDRAIDEEAPDVLVFDYCEDEDGARREMRYGRKAGSLDKQLFLSDISRDIRMNSSLWNKVMKRALFSGLSFDERLRCLEDYALLHRLIMRADAIEYRPLFLYYYRIRHSGLVRTPDLAISYQSYLTALARKNDLAGADMDFGWLGCVLQARGFCRNYYRMGMPREYAQAFGACRKMILTHVREILKENELKWTHRIKLILIAFPVLGKIHFRNDVCR